MDLRLTKDDHLILMHDETIDRTTTGKGKVLDMTLAEIEKFDAGSWKDGKYKSEPVPTMKAIAEVCKGKAIMMLDLKCTGLGDAIQKWMQACEVKPDQIILAPWTDEEGAALRKILPDPPMIRLTSSVPAKFDDAYFERMKQIGFSGFSVNWPKLPQAFVDGAHKHQMIVHTWTVNEPNEVAGAVLAGVDGIITDDVTATMKQVAELTKR
jgi:glycerophosphoryl diester phosphodiesterase